MDADEGPSPVGSQPGEGGLARRYHRAVDRLMTDYQRSYDPDALGQARQPAIVGERSYSGPFYRTWQQAHAAIAYHKAQVEAAREALPAAEAALHAAVQNCDELRGEFARTHPWRRRKRAQLSQQVEQAEEAVENRLFELSCHQFIETWSAERYSHAAAVIDLLRRNARAEQAARGAVARSLGWRPGQPSVMSPLPRAVPLPGRPVPSRGIRRADLSIRAAPWVPALMAPRVQRPPGRAPRQ